MDNNMTKGIKIIENYDSLKPSFKFIVDNNIANCAPFHNIGHLLCVLSRTYGGAVYHEIKYSEMVELMLAALWHDYGHSQGEKDDIHNVAVARDAVTKFLVENPIDGIDHNIVADIIRTTQFPYVEKGEDLNLRNAILRDADLMVCLEDDWIQTLMFGLCKELDRNMAEMITGQTDFLGSVEMATDWGKYVHSKEWYKAVDNLETLKEIYLG